MNFLYCLDKNYNYQAILSLYTLNKFSEETHNIFIGHNESKSIAKLINKFSFNNLNIIFIDLKTNLKLPNLKNSHVTEATYYRMLALSNLDLNLDHIIYYDSDILFNKSPFKLLEKYTKSLLNSQYIICANTSDVFNSGNNEIDEHLKQLEIKNKYFNAGVIIFDLNKFRNQNLDSKLMTHLVNFNKNAKFWDQDILNTFFEGKYLELPQTLNNCVELDDKKRKLNEQLNEITLHFAGKTKPWHIEAFKYPLGLHFQLIYKEVFKRDFFIRPFSKKRHLKELLSFIKYNNRYQVQNKIKFLAISIFRFIKL